MHTPPKPPHQLNEYRKSIASDNLGSAIPACVGLGFISGFFHGFTAPASNEHYTVSAVLNVCCLSITLLLCTPDSKQAKAMLAFSFYAFASIGMVIGDNLSPTRQYNMAMM